MIVTGPARLYGVTSPATGEEAQLTIDESQLTVRTADLMLSSALSVVRVREVGTGVYGLELAWDTAEGLRVVQVFDPPTLTALRASQAVKSLPQMAALRARQRRGSAVRTAGWVALALFLLLPVLLIVLFVWQAERFARAAATRVSIEQEIKLGEQAFAAMRGSLKLQEGGPAHDAVTAIGAKLTQSSAYRYQFHVAEDEAINAFAVPGGIIVVHTGLINATRRPEELAGVLAHEVQHVEQRHSLHAMIKDLGLRGLWLLLSGDVGTGLVGQAALELTSLRFSRDAESQADAQGFDDLIDAGIDPSGMGDFFTTMGKHEGAVAPPPLMSTHPASADREAAMRAREAEVSTRTFQPLNLGVWPPSTQK